jgi:transcriptional regulator with PAS, ATPase and Fis domain
VSAKGQLPGISNDDIQIMNRLYHNGDEDVDLSEGGITIHPATVQKQPSSNQTIEVEESLSLQDKEIDMIKKALKKHKGKRKYAAQELGISERTLYRKINEYKISE